MIKVSLITPTTLSRKYFIPGLEKMINDQVCPGVEIEWLVDHGEGSIGKKRNRLCSQASGEIIIHFDDDDWYGPNYIVSVVNVLTITTADVTGLSTAWFHNEALQKAWLYQYAGKQPYVIGSGMAYHKSVWARNCFRHISHGEDMHFLTDAGRIIPHNCIDQFYARIHSNNTASHQIIPLIKERPIEEFRKVFNKKPPTV